jgi:hypothetical protein
MHASDEGRPAAPPLRMVAIGVVILSALLSSGLGMGAAATAAPRALPAAAAPSASKSKAEVKANWLEFFNAKTKPARRIRLLESGPQFANVIREASKNPLASTLGATVAKVTLVSKTKANVTYSLTLGGQSILSHEKGTSVYQRGIWKVGASSFCQLLVLEQGGKKTGLPRACQSGK